MCRAIENEFRRLSPCPLIRLQIPINLYGVTKLCSDSYLSQPIICLAGRKTRFSVVRYGNVAGSRGVSSPFSKALLQTASSLPITHEDMTRFIITLDEGVSLVTKTLGEMYGGEIIVPKLPSIKITDLVPLLGNNLDYHITGTSVIRRKIA